MPPSFDFALDIDAPPDQVWACLTDPALMPQWMGEPEMALTVTTDWTPGGPIVIAGFHHVAFRNTGTVLAFEPSTRLAYTHLSSLSRLADEPAHHSRFEFRLQPRGAATALTMNGRNFATESIYRHLEFYWAGTLALLKAFAQARHRAA